MTKVEFIVSSVGIALVLFIGETGRKMIIRVSEQLSAWLSSSFDRSAFADHLLTSGHMYRGGSAALIHRKKSFKKRKAREEIEIFGLEYCVISVAM